MFSINSIRNKVLKIFTSSMITENTLKTKYIAYKDGGSQNLFVNEREIKVSEGELLMRVKAIGINRAETLQRMGKYTVTKEVEKYLGLEACGQIVDPISKQKLYDGMALLSGGSYSQWAIIPKDHAMKVPSNLNYSEGSAIPQAWLTAFQLIGLAQLKQGQDVIIYAAASGVGTAAIQICNVLKLNAFAVVSSQTKRKACMQVGAKGCVLYKDNEKWDQELIQLNYGKRFSAVLDCVGVSNIDRTLNLCEIDARWILYGLLSGVKTQFNFMKMMQKRIVLKTTLLKTRSYEYKTNLIKDFSQQILPHFETNPKQVHPLIDSVLESDFSNPYPFKEAHDKMQNNLNIGKIVIEFK